jgi:hypothetical protein
MSTREQVDISAARHAAAEDYRRQQEQQEQARRIQEQRLRDGGWER